jgi:uncharacterized cupredoxin-like copper-binding protein
MKTLISILLATAVPFVVVRADQETVGEKTADAWHTTKHKAKEAGRAVVRTTEKAAHAVGDALTPEADARRAKVQLTDYAIDMPTRLPAGKTAFVVHNAGSKPHNFEVRGEGIDKKFLTSVEPGKVKVLHVDLESGAYKVFCPIDGHAKKGMTHTLIVR